MIVAFAIVVLVVVGTAILNSFNGGLGHTRYIAGLWTVIALIGLGIYYGARAVTQRVRR